MAKGNQWFRGVDGDSGHSTRRSEGLHKIPLKYRKPFYKTLDIKFGGNKLKWVSKRRYEQFVDWYKKNILRK